MARIRRIVRKLAPAGRSFDEQLWPVYLALLVLGGYLAGMVLALCRFNDVRIWANAVTWLIAIPLFVGGSMWLMAFLDDRKFNRRALLALVLSLIVNFVLLTATTRVYWVRWLEDVLVTDADRREQIQKTIPEYHEFQLQPQDTPQQDFQKPVETEIAEPEPEKIERQENEPEEAKPKPVEADVPKPEEKVEPNEVQKKVVETSAPRRSESQSKLSRQKTQFKPKAVAPAAVVKVENQAQKQPSKLEAKETDVARQTNQARSTPRRTEAEPTSQAEAQEVKIDRRETAEQQVAQSTSAPTLKRAMSNPKMLPRTTAEATDVSAPTPKQSSPEQVKPSTTVAQKQQTTSPQEAKVTTEPTPETPTEIAQAKTARQQQAERMPDVAQSNKPVPNRTRPTLHMPRNTVTAAAKPVETTNAKPAESQIRPQTAQVARQSTNTPSPDRTPKPTDAPQVNRPAQIAEAQTQRAQSSEVATANPQARPSKSPSRAVAQNMTVPNRSAQAVQVAAAAQPTETQSPRAAGAAVSKQSTSSSQVAKATADPTPQSPASVTEVSTAVQSRQQAAQPAVNIASTSRPTQRRTTPTTAAPAVTNIAAVQTTPTKSPVKSESPSPAPSASTVARQATTSQVSSPSPRAMDTPTKSATTELARAPTSRAKASNEPTIRPTSRPTPAPARAAKSAELASSPAAIAAPAVAASSKPTSNPSAEPARAALNKAFGGTAGVGRSSNLSRAMPAAERPAMVASGSARRAQATQQMESDRALSPSAPARISRSRAGAQAPSSTLAATAVENATAAGASQPAELEASSSAALAKNASNAQTGPTTADKGDIEVDLGSTQQISENATGKASGGGQPTLNFETQSHQVARSEIGGAPNVTLAVDEVAPVAAPAAGGGGEPLTPEASPDATAVVRTETGGQSPATAGPASAQSDPAAESASAQEIAEAQIGRAESIEAANGKPETGGGSNSPERTATGPKLIATVAAATVDPSQSSSPPAGDPKGAPPAPADTQLARVDASGGTPTAGGPTKATEVGAPSPEAGQPGGATALVEAQMGRAEAIDSTPGKPAAGGGTASPTRQATGPAFVANSKAETIALAGAPVSGGTLEGSPIEAQGTEAIRTAAGAVGQATNEIAGALAGKTVLDAPMPGAPGDAPGGRKASPAKGDGPDVGELVSRGGPFKRAAEMSLPSGSAPEQVAMADPGGTAPASEVELDAMVGGMDETGITRQSAAGGLAVDVDAPEGPGGVSTEVAIDSGTMNRRAQHESQEVHFRQARFIRTRSGGPLAINLTASTGTKAFLGRSKFKNNELQGEGGQSAPTPKTEKSIELGLRFLANHQSNDGSWSLSNFGGGRRGYEKEQTALHSDTGATGLCLLAFLGAGYHHLDDTYQEVVRSGIDYLLKNQKDDGNLFVNQDPDSSAAVWLYSHGIATIALCEAYGMTQDPDLREPAQKAINFIVDSQHKDRGGWRYSPNFGSDTSVTGWMMMALKSGELSGLKVPQDTYEKIDHWLQLSKASDNQPHLYVYNPLAPDTAEQRHGRRPSQTMTSVGLLMRLYAGWKRDNPNMIRGARYLMENLPDNGTRTDPRRDTYYWYYATQVMFHMRGKYWETWSERLHGLLTDSQIQSGPFAGSWDPKKPIPDRWGPHAGRIYVTTLNLLSLEVAYRHLPIYDDTAK